MHNNASKDDADFGGYLHIRGTGKVKSSKKHCWFKIDIETNRLQSYKSSKDVEEGKCIESLPLFGAGISFGNTDDHEFNINIRGSEYRLNADSHKMMMRWTNKLQRQAKIKPVVLSPSLKKLETVLEDDPLEISQEDGIPHRRSSTKKKNIFQRIFSKRRSKKQESSSTQSIKDNERVVKAAPLRSVVGSMQDISTKPSSCNNCNLLQGHNSYLTTQVQELNEDVENVKQELREYIRKFTSLERSQITIKKAYLVYVQNSLAQDDGNYNNVHDIPGSKNVLDMLSKERETDNTLPSFDNTGKMEPYTDRLGFTHGNRESAMQILLYVCDLLKFKYTTILQDGDDIYQQWQTYAISVSSESILKIDGNLQELVTHGMPHELRGTIWKQLIMRHVQDVVQEKGSGYYKSLVNRLPDLLGEDDQNDGSIEKQIKIDLLRTMPTHTEYQEFDTGKVPLLHRVLRAYVLHNPEIGYSQGMNFMVGFALLYVDEETSFWLLVAVSEILFSKHHYNMYLSGTQANQKVMDEICRKEFPDLIKHLDDLMCEIAPITFNWFMTIFIDSLPIETVLKIWDVFLVYGHPILYRIALALVKFYKTSIMKGKDALAAMRKLKKLGRSFHDTDSLLKEVFNDNSQPSPNYYLDLYNKNLELIEKESKKRKQEDEEYEIKKQKIKFTPKQMMVSISDNLDELDDDLIIRCAQCEANRNYVWLLCTSDLMGQIFVLNVASRKLDPIDWQVDCKCLAMATVSTANIMLVSTIKSSLHAIDVENRHEIWMIQLAGSALDISCDSLGNVALSLMDGTVALLNIKGKEFHQNYPTYVDISRSPVFCGCIVNEVFWCGAANKIILLDLKTLETSTSLRVCSNERHTVSQLVASEHGVWSSVQGCSVLHLWDPVKHICLLTVDVLDECGLSSEKTKGDAMATRITTLMSLKDKLWVGFGNGRFIICDIFVNANNEDDLNDAITLFKSMENLTVEEVDNGSHMKKSSSKLSIHKCCHQIIGEDNNSLKNNGSPGHQYDDRTDFVMVDKRMSSMGSDRNDVMLKMNQIQRVCENQINAFIQCRQDGKLVLSCMGALNDDSSVILWSSERRDGREMWFAQTVSCNE